jgi:hypothetical protein
LVCACSIANGQSWHAIAKVTARKAIVRIERISVWISLYDVIMKYAEITPGIFGMQMSHVVLGIYRLGIFANGARM